MKKRHLILIGGLFGFLACFGLFVYGNQVVASVQAEFLRVIQYQTDTIVYKAQNSDSKIAIMWAEKEEMPWKEALTVRVGTPKDKNTRTIIFQKQ